MLLIWWFLASVSPGIVLSNNARPLEETPRMPLQKGTKTEALGPFMLRDLRGR